MMGMMAVSASTTVLAVGGFDHLPEDDLYRAPCGGGAEKRNLLAPSPRCCMQRRATTAYRLPVPLGTPPLLNV